MKKDRNYIDILTFIATVFLLIVGIIVVESASATVSADRYGSASWLFTRHTVKVFIGLAALFLALAVDYHRYQKITKGLLIVSILFLLVTLLLGGEVKGATRWLRFGGFGFQPSEFAKVALILHLSSYLAVKREVLGDFRRGFLPLMVWIGAVTVLVMFQPNFSTGAMILLISFVLLFIGCVRLPHLAGVALLGIPVVFIYLVSAQYRLDRLLAFLHGGQATTYNYQVEQGIVGFGNGGIFGIGPGQSKQRLFFLPESYGDFIYSIVGEEYGLIGTLLVLAAFFILCVRGFKIARHAPDPFGRYLAAGITTTITLYALVNAGVTLGLLPTTGLPMPFVSYGGSALVFVAFEIGVLLNISRQTDLHPRLITMVDAMTSGGEA